jgi:hypothetical protein
MSDQPPLIPLHDDKDLSSAKVRFFEKLDSEALRMSLAPGQEHSLKSRPDGTMLDRHHRVHVLRGRGEEVNGLPREVLPVPLNDSEE